ncbi:MAG: helix-turn-helix transcriptional regulator [Candidatus Pseudobacter hemicellulosilyticus]|uniref:Helix-turn-helix transcriptional regulator n=1 Tax=Candidatus Pseudobacter hemicellulosilyticus TaxID=3121375 RepID=A0AAJ5WTB7_9BACT|nr:MAG: helix-turn-helix transcriptional regulator [Pseudobacter sp.]
MPLHKYKEVINNTPDEIKYFVEDSMHILDRIHELLDDKFEGKQKLLAEKLGKSEAEVSKMLSGVQNFTLKTLSKLRAAFGEPIIAVCTNNHEQAVFTPVKNAAWSGRKILSIKPNGRLAEENNTVSTYIPIETKPVKGENKLA